MMYMCMYREKVFQTSVDRYTEPKCVEAIGYYKDAIANRETISGRRIWEGTVEFVFVCFFSHITQQIHFRYTHTHTHTHTQ